jgi:hypothetical protein
MVAPLQLQTGRKQASCTGDPHTGFASAPHPGASYLRTWPAGHGPPSTLTSAVSGEPPSETEQYPKDANGSDAKSQREMVSPLQLQTGRKQASCMAGPHTGCASAPHPGASYLRTWPAGHGPLSDELHPPETQTAVPAKSMTRMSPSRLGELWKKVIFRIITEPAAKSMPAPGKGTANRGLTRKVLVVGRAEHSRAVSATPDPRPGHGEINSVFGVLALAPCVCGIGLR